MINVLFVCLGNICRSPLAEAVFDKLVEEAGLQQEIQSDSAGTSDYHIGEKADRRSIEVASRNGLQINHLGRQFTGQDFDDFDYIIAMDKSNEENIKKLLANTQTHPHIYLMREFDETPENGEVPDPYWSGKDGFELVHRILLRSCRQLLDYIKQQEQLG